MTQEGRAGSLAECALQNHMLEMDAKRAPAPGWETIRYMVSVVQYGGRITDEYDKLLMDTLAEKYFQPVGVLTQSAPQQPCLLSRLRTRRVATMMPNLPYLIILSDMSECYAVKPSA